MDLDELIADIAQERLSGLVSSSSSAAHLRQLQQLTARASPLSAAVPILGCLLLVLLLPG